MSGAVNKLKYNQINLNYIVLKNNVPISISKETLIEIIQDDNAFSSILITHELLERIGCYKTVNPINKDIYFDIEGTIARIIYDHKFKTFRLNFKYSIKSPNTEISDALHIQSLNQLQHYLEMFYGIRFNHEALLKKI